ncbi:MAG TPA: GTPase HflX [Candidatus Peregrinibacteria bacterium]|nr:GTPase HflX [Candidatus Peregrinibacteria bacterium]
MNPKKQLRAILIDVIPPRSDKQEAESELEEMRNLVKTMGGITILKVIQKRGRPSAKTFLGSGKAKEVALEVEDLKANVVIVNKLLKPNQILHLKSTFKKVEVWDRIDLILKIFEKHAQTNEAKLQIELARLRHEFPKIYAYQATTLFEKERGGISGTRGAGEKGIEQEKRHLRRRIKDIEKKLERIKKVHENQRKHRKRTGKKTVALVGYTNAGKTSLLQALTHKENLYIADELFATLDTRIGDLWLPNTQKDVLVAGTIGFIQKLPHFLIDSFKTTLEEAHEADLILHVIDFSDPKITQKIKVVEEILKDLECQNKSKIYVFNKIDLLEDLEKRKRLKIKYPKFKPLFISVINGDGIDELIQAIESLI